MPSRNEPKIRSRIFFPKCRRPGDVTLRGKKEKIHKKDVQLEILRMAINCNQTAISQLGKDLTSTISHLNKILIILGLLQVQVAELTKQNIKKGEKHAR